MRGTTAADGIGRHYLRYSLGNVSTILAGLVSFPLMTRLLDNTQYGILGYYDNWMLLAVAVAKFGAQHSLLRFYPHGEDAGDRAAFFTNFFYLPLACSLLLWLVLLVVMATIDRATGAQQHLVFWMAMFAVPMSSFSSLAETILRASEQSRTVLVTRVVGRWLEVALMVGAVVLLSHSAIAAYGGKLAATVLVTGWYVAWVRRHVRFMRSHVSFARMREGMRYGVPMVANEIVAVAIVVVDRLMLKGMLGEFAAVGIYSVGASLAMQLNAFMNTSVFDALIPTANRLYQTEGADAVRALKQRVLLPMTYCSIGMAMLLGLFGGDAIIALSGAAKAASGPVFSVLGMVFALYPLLALSGFGLLLEKRTHKILVLMLSSLAINVALNLWWIPRFHVMGSVYASAISTLVLGLAYCIFVRRNLLQFPAPGVVARALLAAIACLVIAWWLAGVLTPGWMRFLFGSGTCAVVYAGMVLALDARARVLLQRLLGRFGIGKPT
ncbi:oligosaccharide flippase family protein [Solilutibacter silvestris]|uniref:Polysaccharide biosynthesis protein n=1 Tax=Solilutibacter silvestris TaxID=1645665 RepID=A0A2K1PZD5_9GAMM|nr:oligosaccharide flippase family protein [Lysobacter silvestris]PNS08140.1 Polysaccharide biosynthesis protein [Lysobacter silvestris]